MNHCHKDPNRKDILDQNSQHLNKNKHLIKKKTWWKLKEWGDYLRNCSIIHLATIQENIILQHEIRKDQPRKCLCELFFSTRRPQIGNKQSGAGRIAPRCWRRWYLKKVPWRRVNKFQSSVQPMQNNSIPVPHLQVRL